MWKLISENPYITALCFIALILLVGIILLAIKIKREDEDDPELEYLDSAPFKPIKPSILRALAQLITRNIFPKIGGQDW